MTNYPKPYLSNSCNGHMMIFQCKQLYHMSPNHNCYHTMPAGSEGRPVCPTGCQLV